jgi:hypothetical protein
MNTKKKLLTIIKNDKNDINMVLPNGKTLGQYAHEQTVEEQRKKRKRKNPKLSKKDLKRKKNK